ncbi:MAG: hypothetical protein OEY63_07420 [Gemmatimonadota bacterium]|nr:hypothetical protein [Gemmatimonadota bacterium]MDH5804978.1 hypothetical protein [Gemmatimonadota bacterium]
MTKPRRHAKSKTWVFLLLYAAAITVVPVIHAQEAWAEDVHVEAAHDSQCTKIHSEIGCLVGTATGDPRPQIEPIRTGQIVRRLTPPAHTHISHDTHPAGLENSERGPPLFVA